MGHGLTSGDVGSGLAHVGIRVEVFPVLRQSRKSQSFHRSLPKLDDRSDAQRDAQLGQEAVKVHIFPTDLLME